MPQLNRVIEQTITRFRDGGRLIYIGGYKWTFRCIRCTECVPTFNTHPNEVIGLIGGQQAMTEAIEGLKTTMKWE